MTSHVRSGRAVPVPQAAFRFDDNCSSSRRRAAGPSSPPVSRAYRNRSYPRSCMRQAGSNNSGSEIGDEHDPCGSVRTPPGVEPISMTGSYPITARKSLGHTASAPAASSATSAATAAAAALFSCGGSGPSAIVVPTPTPTPAETPRTTAAAVRRMTRPILMFPTLGTPTAPPDRPTERSEHAIVTPWRHDDLTPRYEDRRGCGF